MSNSEVMDNHVNTTDLSDEQKSSDFTRKNIESHQNIKLNDRDEANDLDLFCYLKCSNSDEDIIKQCRGVIFNGDNVVMKAFPYTEEYTTSDNLSEILKDVNLEECDIYDAYEGTLIRIFYFNNKWFISTHRKLNAFRSKWASKESFGTTFKRALEAEIENNEKLKALIPLGEENTLERFQSILDKSRQYMFLIKNINENRIVCYSEPPMLYHVGTFIDGNISLTDDIHIPYPNKLNFRDIETLNKYVDNIDIRYLQGVILFTKNKQYKVYNCDYMDMYKVRGNEPSIKFRYLQVRMDNKYREMLYYMYPDMKDLFENYENILYDIACSINDSYVQRFIKKQHVIRPKNEFKIMSECHSWHLSDRENNKVNINKVIEVMNNQTPTYLNNMIKEVLYSKKSNPSEGEEKVPEIREKKYVNRKRFLKNTEPTV
jgi:hypothetical protein